MMKAPQNSTSFKEDLLGFVALRAERLCSSTKKRLSIPFFRLCAIREAFFSHNTQSKLKHTKLLFFFREKRWIRDLQCSPNAVLLPEVTTTPPGVLKSEIFIPNLKSIGLSPKHGDSPHNIAYFATALLHNLLSACRETQFVACSAHTVHAFIYWGGEKKCARESTSRFIVCSANLEQEQRRSV